MVQIPPPQPKKKTPPRGVFSFLLAWRGLRHVTSPGYESDERSSMGECGCALPVADKARAHEWQRSQRSSERRRGRTDAGTATGQANAKRL